MPLPIAQQYLREHGSLDQALNAFAEDLMRGDPATFKAGYSRENAVIATAEAFDVPKQKVYDALGEEG